MSRMPRRESPRGTHKGTEPERSVGPSPEIRQIRVPAIDRTFDGDNVNLLRPRREGDLIPEFCTANPSEWNIVRKPAPVFGKRNAASGESRFRSDGRLRHWSLHDIDNAKAQMFDERTIFCLGKVSSAGEGL